MSHTVLFTSELGSGLGHLSRLLPIANSLVSDGHRVVLATPDPVRSRSFGFDKRVRLVRSENAIGPNPPRKFERGATSYGDVLGLCGYACPSSLAEHQLKWTRLIHRSEADLIVADHSPTVLLAARDRLPVVVIGDGFTIPWIEQSTLQSWSDGPTLFDAQQILESIRKVQGRLGAPVPNNWQDVVCSNAAYALTFDELDPYRILHRNRGQKSRRLDGPLEDWVEPQPASQRRGVFFYLSCHHPAVPALIDSLTQFGHHCRGYLKSSTPSILRTVRVMGAEVFESPRPLQAELDRASVVVHHGGLGVATAALAMACPQLIVPRFVEQELNAFNVERAGLGSVLAGPQTAQSIDETVCRLQGSPIRQRSDLIAEKLHRRHRKGCIDQVLDRCNELLRNP